jgi:translation elongation factor EF-Ts
VLLTEENAKFNAKKALEEFVLLDQDFSLAGYNKTVKDALEEQSNKLGSKITVKHFTRFEAGEGIEKVDTFAADVEKLTNKQ